MNIPCKDCTGCLACYNICPCEAIHVETDDEGFYVPAIDNKLCVSCGKCEKVCPVQYPLDVHLFPLRAYAAWTKNKNILRKSSSGGLFSVIAETFLHGGVVYGAAYDKEWNVFHTGIEALDCLPKLRGSKYLQSFIGVVYSDIKAILAKSSKRVLFVGTPCQVAGLRAFLREERVKTDNLLLVDLACHGSPTPKVFKDYIQYLENKSKRKVIAFSFREKKWSWKRYNTSAKFSFFKSYKGKWEEDAYMRGFLRNLFLRQSCHKCRYASASRQGDITLSDYWNYFPRESEIKNNDCGVSVVLINNEKGQKLIESIKDKLVIYERNVTDALASSQPYSKPFSPSPQREEFWEDYKNYGFTFLVNKYFKPEKVDSDYFLLYKYGKGLYSMMILVKEKLGRYIPKFLIRLIKERMDTMRY